MPTVPSKAPRRRARPWVGGLLAIGSALVVASLAASAVDPTAGGAPAPEALQGAPHYSPFVVRVSGTAPFHAISFKDVGMSVPDGDRSYLYESIAEGLALALSSRGPMSVPSEVRYSAEVANPENHRACESGHIYVDMWHNQSTKSGSQGEYWGYSLWSGCGEDDRFAWKKIPVGEGDAVTSIEPLTRDIATSIRRALETKCFSRHC